MNRILDWLHSGIQDLAARVNITLCKTILDLELAGSCCSLNEEEMKYEIMHRRLPDSSEWDACSVRIATVQPQIPGGLSLVRCHGGNTLFHLNVGGKTPTTSADCCTGKTTLTGETFR